MLYYLDEIYEIFKLNIKPNISKCPGGALSYVYDYKKHYFVVRLLEMKVQIICVF